MGYAVLVGGNLFNEKFHLCKHALESVKSWKEDFAYEAHAFLPSEYELYVADELKKTGVVLRHAEGVVGFLRENGRTTYLGGASEILQLLKTDYDFVPETATQQFQALAAAEFETYCRSKDRQFCEFWLSSNGSTLGRLLIELYTDQCPKTVANFVTLVEGTGKQRYKDCPVHRVVKGGYIQTGDVVDGTGAGNAGYTFADESFAVKHEQPGVVGMANLGEPHTNSTQFYITLAPLPWLDGKKVAFGKVLDGLDVLKLVEEADLMNERPYPDIVIHKCAMLPVS